MIKKRLLFSVLTVAVVLLLGAALAGAAGTGEPGTVDDPLVTRSYVDARINSALSAQLDEALKAYAEKYMAWRVIDLSPGQQLEGKAGTEIIVRAGNSVVIDPVGSGIPDLTGGINVSASQTVSLDHLLIIPRTDGRGISARTKSVVMYKGEVQVK